MCMWYDVDKRSRSAGTFSSSFLFFLFPPICLILFPFLFFFFLFLFNYWQNAGLQRYFKAFRVGKLAIRIFSCRSAHAKYAGHQQGCHASRRSEDEISGLYHIWTTKNNTQGYEAERSHWTLDKRRLKAIQRVIIIQFLPRCSGPAATYVT